jgi:hypothetical protein
MIEEPTQKKIRPKCGATDPRGLICDRDPGHLAYHYDSRAGLGWKQAPGDTVWDKEPGDIVDAVAQDGRAIEDHRRRSADWERALEHLDTVKDDLERIASNTADHVAHAQSALHHLRQFVELAKKSRG